mgnify:CR=1 FL=1
MIRAQKEKNSGNPKNFQKTLKFSFGLSFGYQSSFGGLKVVFPSVSSAIYTYYLWGSMLP